MSVSPTSSEHETRQTGSSLSADEHAERLRARESAYELFRSECALTRWGVITTTVDNSRGSKDRIELYARPSTPKVVSTDLHADEPVRFSATTYTLEVRRYSPPEPPKPKSPVPPIESVMLLDFAADEKPTPEDLAEEDQRRLERSPERIQAELRAKFAQLGVSDMPVAIYAKRLSLETGGPQAGLAYVKAQLMMPLYRAIEAKRVLTEPDSPDYGEVVIRRQHVYTQLTGLLREARMDPAELTRYMMEGLYDGRHIAGVPIFGDRQGNRYVVVNYTYGGYDEQHPEGTDFYGSYSPRENLSQVLGHAEALGYSTFHAASGVSGGTHQHWDWDGIKIEGYDPQDPEGNTQRVLKILKDLGINPQEAVSTINPMDEPELYMRNQGQG